MYLGFTTEKNNAKILNVPFVTHGYLHQYFPYLKKENNKSLDPFMVSETDNALERE